MVSGSELLSTYLFKMKVISEKVSKNKFPGRQKLLKTHFHIKMHSFRYVCEQCNMQLPGPLFGFRPQNFSPQKILIPALKAFLIFRKRNFLIFSSKKFFLYFGKGIFRTLAYLQLKAYLEPEVNSEHCQTSTMEHFAEIAT